MAESNIIPTGDIAELNSEAVEEALTTGKPIRILQAISDIVESQRREWDLAKKKDRDECAGLAYAITRSRTAIEKIGKELIKEKRASIEEYVKQVQTQTAVFTDSLNELRDNVREPLDAWELERKKWEDRIEQIAAMAKPSGAAKPSSEIESMLAKLSELESVDNIPDDIMADYLQSIVDARDALQGFYDIAKQREKDAAELEMFRRQQAEALQREQREQVQQPKPEQAPASSSSEPAPVSESIPASVKSAAQERQRDVHNQILHYLKNSCPVPEATAKVIVQHMAAGRVPHVTINY